MTDTDVLKEWRDYIEVAESGGLQSLDECFCIADLAAEVRALRQLHIDDDARYMKAIERIVGADDEIMVLKARVAELESTAYPRDALCDTYESRLDELNQENRELRERLAALEPDATLGRLVREGELLK